MKERESSMYVKGNMYMKEGFCYKRMFGFNMNKIKKKNNQRLSLSKRIIVTFIILRGDSHRAISLNEC